MILLGGFDLKMVFKDTFSGYDDVLMFLKFFCCFKNCFMLITDIFSCDIIVQM